MTMKRKIALSIGLLIILSICGCSMAAQEKESDLPIYFRMEPQEALKENTPSKLAVDAGNVNFKIFRSEMDAEEAYEVLLNMSSKSSAQLLRQQKTEFIKQIEETAELFDSLGEQLVSIDYSETEYASDTRANVRRILKFTKMEMFYQQDFIFEDGAWKICGDNITNDFIIRDK